MAASGWNPNPDAVQRFSLQSRAETSEGPKTLPGQLYILLIEDNPADADLVREALQQNDVVGELIVISDGESAIDFVQKFDAKPGEACPDLIILDLNLPRRPGMQVLEAILLSGKCGLVPVAILSSSEAQQDRQRALQLGARGYFSKPARLDDFLNLGLAFKAMAGKIA